MERGTDIKSITSMYRTRNEGDFPPELVIRLKKEWDLKYGENPHQHGAMYSFDEINGKNASKMAELTNLVSVRSDGKGKGGLSLTNTIDISRAMDNLKWFSAPTAVIMKHTIVSGFATQARGPQSNAELYDSARKWDENYIELFRTARDADRRSNFGGTFAINRPLDMVTVDALFELPNYFMDVIAAPGFEEGVVSKIEGYSRNCRIAEFSGLGALPRFVGDDTYGLVSIKEMPGGRVGIQDIYLTRIRSGGDLILDPMKVEKDNSKHIIQRDPTKEEIINMLAAWWLNISGARSNGVVMVRGGVLGSMGSGQTERVGAIEQAIVKGMQKAFDREGMQYDPLYGIMGYEKLKDNPFAGAAVSSDAFFPFGDSIRLMGRIGIKAVVQPYGSIRDAEVIDAANEYKMAMPATGERCFGHF